MKLHKLGAVLEIIHQTHLFPFRFFSQKNILRNILHLRSSKNTYLRTNSVTFDSKLNFWKEDERRKIPGQKDFLRIRIKLYLCSMSRMDTTRSTQRIVQRSIIPLSFFLPLFHCSSNVTIDRESTRGRLISTDRRCISNLDARSIYIYISS